MLSGADKGPALSLTLVNAGAAVYAAGRGGQPRGGRARGAAEAVDSGAANDVMERFVSRTQELAAA